MTDLCVSTCQDILSSKEVLSTIEWHRAVHAVAVCLRLVTGNSVHDHCYYIYSEHAAAVLFCKLDFAMTPAAACQHMLRKPVACHKYSQ